MNDDEINQLWALLKAGKIVVWHPNDVTCRQVLDIRKRKDEPSEVAVFSGLNYAALYNCGLDEFCVIERLGKAKKLKKL